MPPPTFHWWGHAPQPPALAPLGRYPILFIVVCILFLMWGGLSVHGDGSVVCATQVPEQYLSVIGEFSQPYVDV